jgi:hypothetical protein
VRSILSRVGKFPLEETDRGGLRIVGHVRSNA